VIGAYGGPLTEISDHAFEDEMPRLVAGWQVDSVCGQTARRQFPKLYITAAAGGASSRLVVEDFDFIPAEMRWDRDRMRCPKHRSQFQRRRWYYFHPSRSSRAGRSRLRSAWSLRHSRQNRICGLEGAWCGGETAVGRSLEYRCYPKHRRQLPGQRRCLRPDK
jgi:hypothetical protein